MTITWPPHDYHVTATWLSHDRHMTITWLTHDCHMTITTHMTITWPLHDCHMTVTWLSHDCHMTATWLSHDYHMTATWLSHDCHMTAHWMSDVYWCTCTIRFGPLISVFSIDSPAALWEEKVLQLLSREHPCSGTIKPFMKPSVLWTLLALVSLGLH